MTQAPVSVVIVSRQRPDELRLCLSAVARLSYSDYEVIVVADPAGLAAVETLPFAKMIKTVAFDEANISAARNRGVAQAAGQIVAFLDDDCVPETRWLEHLAAAFDDPDVAAAGGFVRGRNGISFQWQGRIVDQSGRASDVILDSHNPTRLTPPKGWAVKTEGTNMAVRRYVLAGLGGFDPAFRFYLDETDLNMRLAQTGHATAIVPLAQVHHGYAASVLRRQDRAVRDLRQIAASTVVFLRKHCPAGQHAAVLDAAFEEQRRGCMTQLVSGQLEPRDIRRLMASWREGLRDGQNRSQTEPMALPSSSQEFRTFHSLNKGEVSVIQGFRSNMSKLREQAAQEAKAGRMVSLFLMSRGTLYQRVSFNPLGYWEQTGGLWGRSERDDPMFKFWRLSGRVIREKQRIGAARFHEG